MRIMAIDPGTKNLGWAIFEAKLEEGSFVYQKSGVVKIRNKSLTWLQRLDLMVTEVRRIMSENENGVDCIVIEKPEIFQGSNKGRAANNSGTILKLTSLVFSIRMMARIRGKVVILIPVIQWKGQIPKAITQKRIKTHLGIDIESQDESDAVGLGMYYVNKVLKCGVLCE